NGRARVSHGGYHHDVHSNVMLFPQDGVGCVCFTNFGCPRLADFINQYAFDTLMNLNSTGNIEEALCQYEKKIEENSRRLASNRRIENTAPSHSLDDYSGAFTNAAYGKIEIRRNGEELEFKRNHLVLPLRHWHYD